MELHVDYLINVLPIVGTGNAGRFPGHRRDHRRCEPAERAHFQRKIMTGVRHSPDPRSRYFMNLSIA